MKSSMTAQNHKNVFQTLSKGVSPSKQGAFDLTLPYVVCGSSSVGPQQVNLRFHDLQNC